jgi:hypothetical protein
MADDHRWRHPRAALRRALLRNLAREAILWRREGLDLDTFVRWSTCFATPAEFFEFRTSGMKEELLSELFDRVRMHAVQHSMSRCSLGAAALSWWRQGWRDPAMLAVVVVSGFEPVEYTSDTAAEMLDLARMRRDLLEWG